MLSFFFSFPVSILPDEIFAEIKEVTKALSSQISPRVIKAVAFNLLSHVDFKKSHGESNELDATAFAAKLIDYCGIHVEAIKELLAAFSRLKLFEHDNIMTSIIQAVEQEDNKAKIEANRVSIIRLNHFNYPPEINCMSLFFPHVKLLLPENENFLNGKIKIIADEFLRGDTRG